MALFNTVCIFNAVLMTPQILEKQKAVPFIFLFCRLRKAFLGTPSNGCFNEIVITLDDDIYILQSSMFSKESMQ